MIPTRACLLSVSVFLVACEAPPSPTPDPARETATVSVRDRTVWDGLDDVRAPVADRVSSAPRAAPPRRSEPVRQKPAAPRVPMVSGLSFDDEPLDEALKRLQLITGAPILVTPKGRGVIADQGVTIDLQLTAPVRLDNVLDLLVQQSPDLGWKVDDGVIWVTTKSDARGPMRLRMYDVRDLLMARPNFPAPKIQGLPTGEEDYGSSQEPESTRVMEPDELIDLIKNATDPDYWEETDGASIDVTQNGVLLVRADARMQGMIGGAIGAQR